MLRFVFGLHRIMLRQLLLGVVSVAAWPALAQERVALAGVEAGRDSQYAYLGMLQPVPGQTMGHGLVQRYWLDYTGYRYEKAPGQDIDAEVAGVEAALGLQGGSDTGWWGAYLGARYGNTWLDPKDYDNDDRGGKLYAKLQLEGETAVSPGWRINGIVSYLVGESSFWSRVRLQTRAANQLLFGPELVAQGDPLYRLYKLGVFVGGIQVGHGAALTVKAGLSKLDSDSASAYGGVEWYKPY